jgi:hypothetical protein
VQEGKEQRDTCKRGKCVLYVITPVTLMFLNTKLRGFQCLDRSYWSVTLFRRLLFVGLAIYVFV